ncbi:SMC-Scp complex subunit ScpB [Dactylosporangium sp. CA-092794]|uniref:SMC-Scp complex subunit ScpB n=1 Tax=Dactylosporangium sp. CA-092794 TaxID=3239929 RepID=UPI003D94B477
MAPAEPEAAVEPEADAEPAVESEPVSPAEPELAIEPAAEPEPEGQLATEPEPEAAGAEAEGDLDGEADAEAEVAAAEAVETGVPEAASEVVAETLPGIEVGAEGDGEAPAEAVRAEMSESELRGAVEAILLVVDEPTSEVTLAQVLEQPVDRVVAALEAASREYTSLGFGFDLRRVAGGWRLYTRPEYAAYVEKFVLDGQQIRLTQAALETLAVVAYKQPVTRSRISAIRGVNCDGVVRTLVTRGLIEETGSEPESGAFLYRTTTLFLEKLGLDSVDQLPPLAPFLPDDIDEIADAQR